MINTWGGRALCIAEKPELGRAVAKAIIGTHKEESGVIDGGDLCVVWAYGHLLTLAEPEEYDERYKDRTDENLLPVFFDDWRHVPPPDLRDPKGKVVGNNKFKRDRLKQIGDLLKRFPTVIHCGDPDDEGQLLIDEILDYFNYKGKVLRVRINDNLPDNIIRQFQRLEDNSKYRPDGNGAYARQMADKCFGVNYSRLASIRAKRFLALGRVMNPTLQLVVMRDLEIEQHEKKKYFDVATDIKIGEQTARFRLKPADHIGEDGKILDAELAKDIANSLKGRSFSSVNFKTTVKSVAAPLPYNATELQADMNGRYGYSLNETISITQNLREKYRAITYNRSDCRYLSEEHYLEAPKVMQFVFSNIQARYPVDFSIKSKCFDDTKISAHHGIIPQATTVDISEMTEKERAVYVAICERYIMQFLPNVKKRVCSGEVVIEEGKLLYHAEEILEKGFTEYFREEKERLLTPIFETGSYAGDCVESNLEEKETAPPKRYTPKTLVKDMCGISKYVSDPEIKKALKAKDEGKEGENGSIGTVATRGIVVDRLLQYGYLEMKGKALVSTAKGRALSFATPENAKLPDVTAKWWLIGEDVRCGRASVNDIMHSVVQEFQEDKKTAFLNDSFSAEVQASAGYGKCPVCGGTVLKGKSKNGGYVWYCSSWKNSGCDFRLYENAKHYSDEIHLTDSKVKKLLAGSQITETLTSKKGVPYKAKLKLKIATVGERHYSNFEFVDFYNPKKTKRKGRGD